MSNNTALTIDVIPLWYEPSKKYDKLGLYKDFVIMHYIDPITMIRYCGHIHKDAIPHIESAIKGAYTISYNTAIQLCRTIIQLFMTYNEAIETVCGTIPYYKVLLPLWYTNSVFKNNLELVCIDPYTMDLYSIDEIPVQGESELMKLCKLGITIEVPRGNISKVSNDLCVIPDDELNAIVEKAKSILAKPAQPITLIQVLSIQYSVLTQRLRTGSKSGTAAKYWEKQERLNM